MGFLDVLWPLMVGVGSLMMGVGYLVYFRVCSNVLAKQFRLSPSTSRIATGTLGAFMLFNGAYELLQLQSYQK